MEYKILIVEDEPTLLDTLEYNLARQGYEICTAADGPTTLATATRPTPPPSPLAARLPGGWLW